MSSKPLVSVVIIFFNTEKFIEEAIESVCAQTYENWELLLVDDGSTDNSTKIALRYAEQYPGKVRYLEHDNHQNRGRSATRNLGIKNAQGEYFAFLDADDVWFPNNLEEQVAILESHSKAGMTYGNTQKWYSWTGNPEDSQRDHLYELGVQTNALFMAPQLFSLLIQEKISAPCTCSFLVQRKVIEDIGGFEESFWGMYDDQVFYAKIFLQVPVFVSSSCWAKYRKHPDSCVAVSNKTGQTDSARLLFLNWVEQYLVQQTLKNSELWQVIQKELWSYRHPFLHRISKRFEHFVSLIKRLVKKIFLFTYSLKPQP
jgi:glycosyltransferase involved in cell wall biosynthesis